MQGKFDESILVLSKKFHRPIRARAFEADKLPARRERDGFLDLNMLPFGFQQKHALLCARFIEGILEERTAVIDVLHLLRLMEMPQSDVVELFEDGERNGACAAEVDVAFALAHFAARREEVRQEDMRHSAPEPLFPRRDPTGNFFRVALLRLLLFEPRFVGIGQRVDVKTFSALIFKDKKILPRHDGADRAVAPERKMPPSAPEEIDAVLLRNGRSGSEADAVVMISRNDDDGAIFPRELLDGMKKNFLRFGGRELSIEYVSRNEHDGDVFLLCDAQELVKRFDLFGQTVSVHEPLADMPIRCLENVHPEKCVLMP